MSFFKRRKKLLLRSALAALLVVAALIIWGFVVEPDMVVVRQSALHLPHRSEALDRLKVVALADIHAGAPHIKADKLRRLVEETNAQSPDLVLLLGDYVIQGVRGGEFVEPEAIAEHLRGLRAPLGVYAVLGNHDWWLDGQRVRRALEAVGIRVLENEVARVEREGKSFWLAGLADFWTRQPDIEGTLRKITDDAPIIVLTHNPDVFPQIPSRVAVTLAGHTHGGQVALPIIGRPVVPSRFGQRYAYGHVREGDRNLFVTSGVGTSIIPVRFRVPPEISVLTFKAGAAQGSTP